MKKEEIKQEVMRGALTVFLKDGQQVSCQGEIEGLFDCWGLVRITEEDGSFHDFHKEYIAVIIADNIVNAPQVVEADKKYCKMITESGKHIAFNGNTVKVTSEIDVVGDTFITDKNDLILLFEEIVYDYEGAPVEELPQGYTKEV